MCARPRLRNLREIEKAGEKDRRTDRKRIRANVYAEGERNVYAERERERKEDRIKETARERVEKHDDDRLESVLRAFKYRVLATEHGKTGERACAARRRRGEDAVAPAHARSEPLSNFTAARLSLYQNRPVLFLSL